MFDHWNVKIKPKYRIYVEKKNQQYTVKYQNTISIIEGTDL